VRSMRMQQKKRYNNVKIKKLRNVLALLIGILISLILFKLIPYIPIIDFWNIWYQVLLVVFIDLVAIFIYLFIFNKYLLKKNR